MTGKLLLISVKIELLLLQTPFIWTQFTHVSGQTQNNLWTLTIITPHYAGGDGLTRIAPGWGRNITNETTLNVHVITGPAYIKFNGKSKNVALYLHLTSKALPY